MTLRGVQRWLAHEEAGVDLVLVCAESGDVAGPGTVVRLTGCAADVHHHELAELLTLGARTVTVDLGGCAAAPTARARLQPLTEALAAARVSGLAVRATPAVVAPGRTWSRGRATPPLDAAHMPVGRRQALGLHRGRPLPPEGADAHDRLVSALRALAAPAAGAPSPAPGPTAASPAPERTAASPAPVLTVDGCTLCAVCVRACPRDALAVTETPAGSGLAITTLRHLPAACDGCLRCVDLCPTDALAAAGAHPWATVLDGTAVGLASAATRSCRRCGATVPATTELCEVCAYRRANPFGSVRVGA